MKPEVDHTQYEDIGWRRAAGIAMWLLALVAALLAIVPSILRGIALFAVAILAAAAYGYGRGGNVMRWVGMLIGLALLAVAALVLPALLEAPCPPGHEPTIADECMRFGTLETWAVWLAITALAAVVVAGSIFPGRADGSAEAAVDGATHVRRRQKMLRPEIYGWRLAAGGVLWLGSAILVIAFVAMLVTGQGLELALGLGVVAGIWTAITIGFWRGNPVARYLALVPGLGILTAAFAFWALSSICTSSLPLALSCPLPLPPVSLGAWLGRAAFLAAAGVVIAGVFLPGRIADRG